MAMRVVLLSLFTFHFSLSHAQHFVGPVLSGGVVQTIDNLPQTHTRLSGGGAIGVAYHYQRGHFLLSAGLDYSLQCPALAVDSQWLAADMIDTRGLPFIYRGLLADRSDRLFMHRLTIPLMAGANWSGVYLLAGLRLSVALAARARVTAALRTAGDYRGRYYEWFEDMPNHGYHDSEPVSSAHSAALRRFDLNLAAEAGYTIRLNTNAGRGTSPLMRIGLFAEYGLFNLIAGTSAKAVTADWSQYLTVTMNHLYTSDKVSNARANLLTYGIRITVLFPLSKVPAEQYQCRCLPVWQ